MVPIRVETCEGEPAETTLKRTLVDREAAISFLLVQNRHLQVALEEAGQTEDERNPDDSEGDSDIEEIQEDGGAVDDPGNYDDRAASPENEMLRTQLIEMNLRLGTMEQSMYAKNEILIAKQEKLQEVEKEKEQLLQYIKRLQAQKLNAEGSASRRLRRESNALNTVSALKRQLTETNSQLLMKSSELQEAKNREKLYKINFGQTLASFKCSSLLLAENVRELRATKRCPVKIVAEIEGNTKYLSQTVSVLEELCPKEGLSGYSRDGQIRAQNFAPIQFNQGAGQANMQLGNGIQLQDNNAMQNFQGIPMQAYNPMPMQIDQNFANPIQPQMDVGQSQFMQHYPQYQN